MKKKKKPKLKSLESLRRKAWELMSTYSRMKDTDHNGYTSCFTCGVTDFWREFDAGHLWHASKQNKVTYDHRNIHAQCRHCNFFNSDAKVVGGLYVDNRYGSGTTADLRHIKSSSGVMRRADLEQVIDDLECEIQILVGKQTRRLKEYG